MDVFTLHQLHHQAKDFCAKLMSRLFAVKGQDKDAPDSSHCFIANILTQVSNHKSEDENFHITFKIIGNHKNFVDKKI